MRRFVLMVGLCCGVSIATGAGAQFLSGRSAPRPPATYRPDLSHVVGPSPSAEDLRQRVRDGRRSGQLSRKDAKVSKREIDQTGVLADRYASDGLSAAERAELQTRGLVLQDQIDARRTAGFDKTKH